MKRIAYKHLVILLVAAAMTASISVPCSFAFNPVSIGDTELNAYGFLRNNYGYFLEDQDYANNDSKLATNRTWLRLNMDYRTSEAFSLFATGQLVYEPEYGIEDGSVSKPDGKEYSEYDNINDVLREAYFDWRPSSSHSFRVGRQIVIWGESLTTKVGDVINPEDTRFTFAFANQEDTRIPQWMVKGLHDFSRAGTSFEWLVIPNLVGEEYRVNRLAEYAMPATGIMVSQRFAMHPEDRFRPPYSVGNTAFLGDQFGANTASPMSWGWVYAPFLPGTGWVPTEIPVVHEEYPEDTLDDTRFGFRTSTFLGGYEFGMSYFHTQQYFPVLKRTEETTPTGLPMDQPQNYRNYVVSYPDVDYIGAYANKDLPVGLLRAEMIYSPNKTYNTFDQTDSDALVGRDYFKYMIAWDLNGLLYFDWHKSAPFDITIEHYGEYIPDNKNVQNIIYADEVAQYNPSISARITTNWFYNLIQTDLIVAYGFNDHDGLLMPVVKWTPTWNNKAFSAELRYINIFGDNDYQGLGMFRQKDMIVLTTQFNF